MNSLTIATFNIHKGFTHFNARLALHHQREQLRKVHADVVFLQEVQGHHERHSQHEGWPRAGQLEYLADSVWPQYAYGKNAIYPAGHHGNALLSKFPIVATHNRDISAHHLEDRGMLHVEIAVPDWSEPLHAVCVHLGLFARWRRKQLADVTHYIEHHVPHKAPLIVAGDFNDWSTRSGQTLVKRLQMQEVFHQHGGVHARSFPAIFPVFKLDRIYARGFAIKNVQVHAGPSFIRVSDHAVLSATLSRTC